MMVCEHCGTIFCWDEADVGALSGDVARYCSRNCKGHARRRRNGRQLRACTARRKVRYASKRDAREAARRLKKYEHRRLYPYQCACGSWHLSSAR